MQLHTPADFDYWYPEGKEFNPDVVYPDPWHPNPVSLEAKHGDGNKAFNPEGGSFDPRDDPRH
jgi:hypothetical protein